MPLDEYKRKRHFEKTPEPSGASRGGRKKKPERRSFVIQKHDASRLHYDFRLELDGVMVSWAVPKGPSLDTSEKRLAMHVEDHPLDYASFEGIIPEGEYGGGTVVVWDRGWWEPQPKEAYKGASRANADPSARIEKGDIKFWLHGEKLQGGWMLVRMKPREGEKGDAWLLIKEKDEHVRAQSEYDILKERPESVATGRTLEEVAEEESEPGGSVFHSNKPAARRRSSRRSSTSPGNEAERAAAAPQESPQATITLPPGNEPVPADTPLQLATLVQQAPEGEGWIHEIKYDGYRMKAVFDGGKARLITRNNLDWTSTFPTVASALAALPADKAVLDGEIVAFDSAGISDFGTLQEAISKKRTERISYMAFDLLYLDGHDLRKAPLLQRKELLKALLDARAEDGVVRYSDHFTERGAEFHEKTCTMGLEGSVSKRGDRPWTGGRTREWLKVKCGKEQEFVIGGFTDPSGGRKGFGALLLGVYDPEGHLRYAGRVGTGFNDRLLSELRAKLDALEIDVPAFANPPRAGAHIHWVRPELVGEVGFAEWTRDGSLRHPSFKGLREDKAPREVTFEIAERAEEATAPGSSVGTGDAPSKKPDVDSARPRTRKGQFGKDVLVQGVKISNPEKLLFEDSPLTKIELVYYYEKVAPFLLPHVARRPLTLVRCPIGRGKGCFYQKHPDQHGVPPKLKTVDIEERQGTTQYMWLDNVAGVLSLAQLGVLEIHTWGSCVKSPYEPDRIIFDLDPGPDVEWKQVVDSAFHVKVRLEDLGFTAFVKTTGGKGLHVVVPVRPALDFDVVRPWTHSFVDSLVAEDPDHLVGKMAKNIRRGKIFVDYVRNAQGATAVSPYSTRARPGAPIAVPVEWDELKGKLDPLHFTADKVLQRLADLERDPWADMQEARMGAREFKKVVTKSLA